MRRIPVENQGHRSRLWEPNFMFMFGVARLIDHGISMIPIFYNIFVAKQIQQIFLIHGRVVDYSLRMRRPIKGQGYRSKIKFSKSFCHRTLSINNCEGICRALHSLLFTGFLYHFHTSKSHFQGQIFSLLNMPRAQEQGQNWYWRSVF